MYLIWEQYNERGTACCRDRSDPDACMLGEPTLLCYARTQFEAVREMKARVSKIVGDGASEPLWRGQLPSTEGMVAVYSLPGPDKSSIDVYNAARYRPWFGTETIVLDTHHYRVYYQTVARSKALDKAESPGPGDVVKSSIVAKSVRHADTPINSLLNAINTFDMSSLNSVQ